jgi:pimeloyl-ACP methyl ester carboxylesterase
MDIKAIRGRLRARATGKAQPAVQPQVRPKAIPSTAGQTSPTPRVQRRARLQDQRVVSPGGSPRSWSWGRIIGVAAGGLLAVPLLAMLVFYLAALRRETNVAADLAPATGRLVETPRGRIFVQEKGPPTGIPVILIHGTAAWSELWRETIDHLANQKFRVIAVDLPPFGFSDRPTDNSYARADHAGRIAALVDALALKKAILVGHSFGAGPTVETVLKFPDKVRGLVLIAGALGISDPAGPQPPPAAVTALLDQPLLRSPLVASLVTNPLMTRTLMSTMVHRKEAITPHRIAVLQRPMTLRGSTFELGNWLRYFVSIDKTAWSMDRGRYAAIKTRTALIWGDKDTLTPLAQGLDLQSLIANAGLTVLPGLGHIPQIEDPAVLATALVTALRAME